MTKKKDSRKEMPKDRHPLHPEKKLVTRRDFISAGLASAGGYLMMPTALELALYSRAARAGIVPGATPAAAGGMVPLLIFDCAGGAALPGNWFPLDQNGQPLPSYSDLGLISINSTWVPDTTFGAPMAGPPLPPLTTNIQSNILAQLKANIPLASQPNLQMCTIPMNTSSDSQSNMTSPLSLVTQAGCVGSMVKNGLGMTAAISGGNSDWVAGNPSNKPMEILSVDSLAAALSYGAAFQSMPVGMLDSLANALINLSGTQAQNYANMTLGQQFNTLAQAGYATNAGYTAGVQGIDPRQDSDCQRIYGINAGSAANSQMVIWATIALNAIMGNSGPGVTVIGGCDYHDGTQTTGDTKDTQIGQALSFAVALAAAKAKKLCVMVYTDGGIYSDPGARTWRGDSNQHGQGVFGFFDPVKVPTMAQTQIGYYNSGQVVEPTLTMNNMPQLIGHTFFLNYMAANGQIANWLPIVQSQDTTNGQTLFNANGGSMTNVANALCAFKGNYS